jgi:glycosyltransferase involved in cell wall biosynthesis
VVIEALAHGVPIVATDCSVSLRDLLGDGAHGEVVPGRDPQAFARAMQRVVTRAPDVEAMRARAQDFTVERASGRYLQMMTALVELARTGASRLRR